jgi:rhomboid protease GluP
MRPAKLEMRWQRGACGRQKYVIQEIISDMSFDVLKGKKYPVAVIAIVAVNMLLFIGPDLMGVPCSLEELLMAGGMHGFMMEDGEYYRLITAAFLHFSFSHVLNNMFVGALLGARLENIVGSIRFLILYLVSAVGANAVSLLYYSRFDPTSLSAGASGAVFGIVGGLLGISLRKRDSVDITPKQIAIYALLSLYSGFATTGVNNIAHLSGMVFGFLLGLVI